MLQLLFPIKNSDSVLFYTSGLYGEYIETADRSGKVCGHSQILIFCISNDSHVSGSCQSRKKNILTIFDSEDACKIVLS